MTLRESGHVCFVPATDLAQARSFYDDVLGLQLVADEGFALVFGLGEATLRITRVEDLTPQPFTILGWEVDDLAAALEQLRAKGVGLERFRGFDQDENGVWRSPSGHLIAWFRDPDGNVLSLSQAPAV